MSRLLRQKKITVIGAVCLLMAAAGAYAYWTQGGSGTGTAATGTTEALTIQQTTVVTGLAPAAPAVALEGTITNPGDGTVNVASVTVAIASVTPTAGNTCTVANYEILNPTDSSIGDILAGASVGWSGPSIRMIDTGVNQDGCKDAVVNLTYSSL